MQVKSEPPSAFALISQGKTVKKTKQFEVEDVDDDAAAVEVDDDDDDNDIDEDEESPFRDPPEGCVRLRPSQFHGIPSTVFVEYPPELSIRRFDHSVIEPLGGRKLGYKSYWERVCIKNAHCRAGFQKSDKYWTSLWSKHQNAEQMRELNCLQKVNHFPASWCIGRKDRLTRTLNTMKRVHGANGSLFDIHPETYILPGERESLGRLIKAEISSSLSGTHRAKSFNSTNATMSATGGMWIVKPCAASCGQGIKVMTGQQAMALPKKKKAVVQRYLARPYLIDGRKFDLRIYVLVSGVDPLRVYIHDEGLTRISTAKYTLKNLTNNFAHLTNYSINKNAPNFKAAEFNTNASNGGDPEGNDSIPTAGGVHAHDPEMEGFKWSLAAFRRWLTQKEGREVMEQTFDRIFDLCLKAVIAAEGEITPHLHSSAQYRTNCFELFGCDVILDTDLRPHLLEVNVSPSLMGSSPLDKKIKGMVIADILHIVGLYPHDPTLLRKYDTNNSAAPSNPSSNTSSKTTNTKTSSAASEGNPFAFNSLSKMMNAQDKYRRSPGVDSIDIAALGDTDASWMLLLMAEDELLRAKSSKFHCVHPTASNAVYYTGLYRSVRFSDHLLAHWVMHGGSRGKCGKYIPYKYRPVQGNSGNANKLGSPEKHTSSPGGSGSIRVEYRSGSAAGRARAKSAGRTTSATHRASTYNPNMTPSSEKIRGDVGKAYHSDHDLSVHTTSRRSQHELQLENGTTREVGSKLRGKSEPRTGRGATPPSAAPVESQSMKQAFTSSPLGARPQLPTTPSSVRTRLESGISKAAFYSKGIADLSLSPSEKRGKDQEVSEFDDEVAGRESVDVASSPSVRQQQRNTKGVLQPHKGLPSHNTLLPFNDASASSKSAHRGTGGSHGRPSSAASTARHGSPSTHSDPASSSNSLAPSNSDDGGRKGRADSRHIRPSTSNKALASSGSAYSLRLERSLNNRTEGNANSIPPNLQSQNGTASVRNIPASVPQAIHVPPANIADEIITRTEQRSPVRSQISPKNAISASNGPDGGDPVFVPSPSAASRTMLTEFALFNEEIRARASASREDSRAYLQNSANNSSASLHPADTHSPLKQRRVSLVKPSTVVVNTAGASAKGSDGVLHSAIHSAGPGSVRSLSKQGLLEQVHKTLFAPVSGSPTHSGQDSSRGSPSDMLALQPQVAAHPSFSQPISPTSGILQQQSKAFGHNTAVVKPVASGKIIQYGNPSMHPSSRYVK